jgi:hypothetical protein
MPHAHITAEAIYQSHHHISPECKFPSPLGDVGVINTLAIASKEALLVSQDIPLWAKYAVAEILFGYVHDAARRSIKIASGDTLPVRPGMTQVCVFSCQVATRVCLQPGSPDQEIDVINDGDYGIIFAATDTSHIAGYGWETHAIARHSSKRYKWDDELKLWKRYPWSE